MLGGAFNWRWRDDRGAVLVEAAIVTPLLILLLFGVWTTARAWNIHNVLDHAAREAARYGAVDPTHAEIQTIAQGEVIAASFPWSDVTFCSAVIDGGNVTNNSGTGTPCILAGTNPGQDPTTDDRVQTKVEVLGYELDFLFFSITVDLRGQAVARLEP